MIRDSYVITRGEALYHHGKEGERKEEGGVEEEDDGSGRERKPAGKKEKRNGNEEEPVIPIPFETLLTREYPMCIRVSFFIFRPPI